MGSIVMAVPIIEGKLDAWRAFTDEITGPRASEFAEMNRRMGLTRHAAWLQRTPMGDFAVIMHEGPGAEEFMGKMMASEQPFDTWMRDTVAEIHPLDQDDPPPQPEKMVDWQA